jgi:hypothetical protein
VIEEVEMIDQSEGFDGEDGCDIGPSSTASREPSRAHPYKEGRL